MNKINQHIAAQMQGQDLGKQFGQNIKFLSKHYCRGSELLRRFGAPILVLFYLWCFYPILSNATTAKDVQLAVWANEAIVATYTLDHEHFIQQEKELARYFTSQGWIDYSQALQASNLPQQIKANSYIVTAVATLPPTIKTINKNEWEASMPILVLYKNPAYSQKQELNVVMKFIESTTQGVRGFAIESLKSTPIATPCRCAKGEQPVTIV